MFITKKKYNELMKRVEELERRQCVDTWKYGKVTLLRLAQIVEKLDRQNNTDGRAN